MENFGKGATLVLLIGAVAACYDVSKIFSIGTDRLAHSTTHSSYRFDDTAFDDQETDSQWQRITFINKKLVSTAPCSDNSAQSIDMNVTGDESLLDSADSMDHINADSNVTTSEFENNGILRVELGAYNVDPGKQLFIRDANGTAKANGLLTQPQIHGETLAMVSKSYQTASNSLCFRF